jgi:Ran GTPase-activating protein (RanGAP) involved in mRNA processing and transport
MTANTTVESLLHLLKAVRCHDPNAQRVCIENKRLSAKYITALFLALVENKYVTKLELSRVGADDLVAWAVAACIRKSISLAQLDLNYNKFSDKGCQQIAQAMQEAGAQSMLRRLNLERNCIGDEGIDQLCRALPYMSSLVTDGCQTRKQQIWGDRSPIYCHLTEIY